MAGYSDIIIIYNPHSTGSGRDLAQSLERRLEAADRSLSVTVLPTLYAGHAEDLAYEWAIKSRRPLVISSSGDGGYHEVVNGLMRASEEKSAKPTAGLLPAGNANDHFHGMKEPNLYDAIRKGKQTAVDLLKISFSVDGDRRTRYAHSYMGLGITSDAGYEINKRKTNFLLEIMIVLRVVLFTRHVTIVVNGEKQRFDSLVFSNVPRMSKIFTISDNTSLHDGKFEVTGYRRRNKLQLIAALATATFRGLKNTRQATRYSFMTTKQTTMQLDGEIVLVDGNSPVEIAIAPAVLQYAADLTA